MITVENLEAIHPDMKNVYERMIHGMQEAFIMNPTRARYLKREAINTIREMLIYRLFKAHHVPNIFCIALNVFETERLKKYLKKKYQYLGVDIADEDLNAEVAELVKFFDFVTSAAITETIK